MLQPFLVMRRLFLVMQRLSLVRPCLPLRARQPFPRIRRLPLAMRYPLPVRRRPFLARRRLFLVARRLPLLQRRLFLVFRRLPLAPRRPLRGCMRPFPLQRRPFLMRRLLFLIQSPRSPSRARRSRASATHSKQLRSPSTATRIDPFGNLIDRDSGAGLTGTTHSVAVRSH
jgi:hypothetical protein